MSDATIKPLSTVIAAFVAIMAAVLFFYVLQLISVNVNRRIKKSKTDIDDLLLSPKIVKAISLVATSLLIGVLLPGLTYHYPDSIKAVNKICRVLNISAVAYLLILETKAFCEILRLRNAQRSGVLVIRNILETLICSVAALLAISTILNRDIAYVVSALGAMAAVLMLVFKDSILGMIAGIRLSLNGMLKEKDWIIVPKYNADGRVEDVSLTTVKVRNWDKSISTIPPHALISEGFINKQRMLDLGVRQIKRTFFVDINSVRSLTPGEYEPFIGKEWSEGIDFERNVINLTLFRKWLRKFMMSHPRIAESSDVLPMQVFVRELPATPTGLPLEIFFFVKCPDWEEFEELQADFIDEITAAFPDFRLRLYQTLATLPS
jgi:hypothetical protein